MKKYITHAVLGMTMIAFLISGAVANAKEHSYTVFHGGQAYVLSHPYSSYADAARDLSVCKQEYYDGDYRYYWGKVAGGAALGFVIGGNACYFGPAVCTTGLVVGTVGGAISAPILWSDEDVHVDQCMNARGYVVHDE